MMQYHEQIKHPLWQKKRLEVLEYHGFECQECGATDHELHVHHVIYKRGAMIWDYKEEELNCLCSKCHKQVHAIDEHIKKMTSYLSQSEKELLAGILAGMSHVGVDRHSASPAIGFQYATGLTMWLNHNPDSDTGVSDAAINDTIDYIVSGVAR